MESRSTCSDSRVTMAHKKVFFFLKCLEDCILGSISGPSIYHVMRV